MVEDGGGEAEEKSGSGSGVRFSSKAKALGLRESGQSNWLTNFHRDLLAGAVMGGVVHTIVAPIERAKLLLQTQESNIAILSGPHRRFKGMFDCIARTIREEGILSLWRGNGSSVLRYYPSVALNFSLKDSNVKFHHLDLIQLVPVPGTEFPMLSLHESSALSRLGHL
ncbi:unnamed protein product [Coffea canephora]|uniref:ADP/ATP translocase n=1 Tax=Coffea canephora TaxID=49390 RepID=A0A068UJ24_COFCA|nr:unnamed protein product [Coffea canephora]